MSILDKIISVKRVEVALLKNGQTRDTLWYRAHESGPPRSFAAALRGDGISVIAEVKRASPSRGLLRADWDVARLVRWYDEGGASALSILTDVQFFQGSLEYLMQARALTGVPILRKDFMIDPWQVAEARAAGADAILLIAAALHDSTLRELLDTAREFRLDALVEVHDSEEMERALGSGAELIGINNRSLHTFETSLQTTVDVLQRARVPEHVTIVSESGIFTPEDISLVRSAGAHAVLVGESLIREDDPAAKLRQLVAAGR